MAVLITWQLRETTYAEGKDIKKAWAPIFNS